MGPLYETIDPDLLKQLLEQETVENHSSMAAVIRFHFEGCLVSIQENGLIVVVRPESD